MSRKLGVHFSRLLICAASIVVASQSFAADQGPISPKLTGPFVPATPVAGPILDPKPIVYSKATLAALMPSLQAIRAGTALPVALPPERMKELLTQKPVPNETLTALFGTVRPVPAPPAIRPDGPVRNVEVAAAR